MSTKKDFLLKFFMNITKSEILHFGYWDLEDEITAENLRKAQVSYIDKILSLIPESTKSIIDVGCGTGYTANKLSDMGYTVSCVSPDLIQKEIIEKKYKNKFDFYCTKFEELEISKKFDLILMMESFGYLEMEPAIKQSIKLLNSGGRILIADIFRKSQTIDYRDFHIQTEFLETIEKYGLKVDYSEDITEKTVPTMEFMTKIYYDYAIPISQTLIEYIDYEMSKKKFLGLFYKVFKKMFKKKIEKLKDGIYNRTPRIINKDNFMQKAKYMIYILSCK